MQDQMIDVQQYLLLGSLNSFSTLITNSSSSGSRGGGGGLNWSNPAECEGYIRTIQEAAEKLASENRLLRGIHENLCTQTAALMSIDLHRQGETWKSKW